MRLFYFGGAVGAFGHQGYEIVDGVPCLAEFGLRCLEVRVGGFIGRESHRLLRLRLKQLRGCLLIALTCDVEHGLGLIDLLHGDIVFDQQRSDAIVVVLRKVKLCLGGGLCCCGALDRGPGGEIAALSGADATLRAGHACGGGSDRALFDGNVPSLVVDLALKCGLIGLGLRERIFERTGIDHEKNIALVNDLVILHAQAYHAAFYLRCKGDRVCAYRRVIGARMEVHLQDGDEQKHQGQRDDSDSEVATEFGFVVGHCALPFRRRSRAREGR